MANDFAACEAFTLEQEGGFSDDPNDPGGATQEGITLAEFQAWPGNKGATVAQLKAMSPTMRDSIYSTNYWNPVQGNALPAGLDLMVFDFGVNTGPGNSALELQRCLGVSADGCIGPDTLAAAAKADLTKLLPALHVAHKAYYAGLSTFAYFGKGWDARADACFALAMQIAGLSAPVAPTTPAPSATAMPPVLSLGDTGTTVTVLQGYLKNAGFYQSDVDGIFGVGTLDGVKGYQASKGLTVDGVAGPITLKALGLA